MQPHELGRHLIRPEQRQLVTQNIIDHWVGQLAQLRISDIRESIINKQRFIDLLVKSVQTQTPLSFIALGCQDWVKPEWGDPHVDRIMGRINSSNKRARRFTTEVASFSSALISLGVPHQIHFTLSDIEALIHIRLQNMGLTIHNSDAQEVLEKNVRFLTEELQKLGAQVVQFTHSTVLEDLFGTTNLAELQQRITGHHTVKYRTFLDNLYKVDLTQTAIHVAGENTLGPVWLDIQSLNFTDDVISLAQAAQEVAPDMPILTIFPNAGSWHAGQQASITFPKREDVVAQMLGHTRTPASQKEWKDKVHKTNDEKLIQLLQKFGQEISVIDSGMEKTLAVRAFFQLVFEFDPFDQSL
ncbi:hypothetical protein KBD71_00505 [Candidatus Woesebacteria bacterium]|nr:hypothetical protein [Candidatus Woesebacteria bacterium]